MKPETKYNFNELISYLFPGSIIISLIFYYYSSDLYSEIEAMKVDTNMYLGAVGVFFFFAASLALGHVCSVWTRHVMRRIQRNLLGNPRYAIFDTPPHKFYSSTLKAEVSKKFYEVFLVDINNTDIREAVPRMIRNYVIEHSRSAQEIRGHIVRARSLSGNLSLPLLILSVVAFFEAGIIAGVLFFIFFIALTLKQIDLDIREWKEVYISFLCVQSSEDLNLRFKQ